jgi:prevent-host-death family protein
MTEDAAHTITQRELRNDSAAIMRGVERGESYTVTRNGTPVARVIPLRRRAEVPRDEVLAAFRSVARVSRDDLREPALPVTELDPLDRG